MYGVHDLFIGVNTFSILFTYLFWRKHAYLHSNNLRKLMNSFHVKFSLFFHSPSVFVFVKHKKNKNNNNYCREVNGSAYVVCELKLHVLHSPHYLIYFDFVRFYLTSLGNDNTARNESVKWAYPSISMYAQGAMFMCEIIHYFCLFTQH